MPRSSRALRPLLFSIAYRITGSVGDAEDAVQETWLRYDGSPTEVASTKSFLSAVVTRISIDLLRSARVRREEYVGEWLPEPLLNDPYQEPERAAELADSVSMAALLLLERLSPSSARSSCCARCSASTTPTSLLPWAVRRQPASLR